MIAPDKVPVVLQQSSSDCGVACLASVIRFFGGKSTLLQLLMGFDSPSEGTILINQVQPLKNTSLDSWRGNVGFVPQEIKIFNGSLISNLTLDENPESFQHAISVCTELGLNEFFEQFPQSYLSQVGEEGINLSGGQKQLVGLIRTLFKQPKLLFLDEFTGAMDRITEQKTLNLIIKIKSEIPVLVVTHRIRPALLADEVMILEHGIMKDMGSPIELLERENLLSESLRDLVG